VIMNFDKNVTFYFIDANDEELDSFCSSNIAYIPHVGSEFSFWSTKDTDGDYLGDRTLERFSGVVIEVKHSLSERAEPSNYTLVEFVEVYVRHKSNEQN
jgi:hypothetical protein